MRGALEDVHQVAGRVRQRDHVPDRHPLGEAQAAAQDQLGLDAVGAHQEGISRRGGRFAGAHQQWVHQEVVRGGAALGAVHLEPHQGDPVAGGGALYDAGEGHPTAVEQGAAGFAAQLHAARAQGLRDARPCRRLRAEQGLEPGSPRHLLVVGVDLPQGFAAPGQGGLRGGVLHVVRLPEGVPLRGVVEIGHGDPAADVDEAGPVPRLAKGVQQAERLGEGLRAGEGVVAVQVEVDPFDPHPVLREVAGGGPAQPGLGGLSEAGGADGPGGDGREAQRDRPGGPFHGRIRSGSGGGELLSSGGGLVEVVEHEGGARLEREAQQGAGLDRGGDHDVAAGDPGLEGLRELAVAAQVEAEPGAAGRLDEAEGLVRLARHEDPQVHAVRGRDGGQLVRVA